MLHVQEGFIQGFSGKPEGRRPLRRSRHRWENSIKVNFQEVTWSME